MKASVSQLPPQSVPTARENGFPDLSTQGASGAFFLPISPSICATLHYLSKSYPMDFVFRFHFYDQHECFSHTLAFYVANLNTTWDKLYKTMRLGAEKMDAQYGGCHGFTKIACINVIGYSSAEIPAEHHNQVMQAWRTEFLHNFVGCAVSEVYNVNVAKVLDGAKIFEYTKDLYEHQQSQQLSDTLITHITTSASPTATRKI